MSRKTLTCAKCGGKHFKIVHTATPKEDVPMFSIGTICKKCDMRSILVWRVEPAPDTAGGLEWR